MDDILKPSLDDNWEQTKIYNIKGLFFVAFLGGEIPLLALGIKNFKSLKIPKKYINIFIVLTVIALIVRYSVFAFYGHSFFTLPNKKTYKYIFRGTALLLYLFYYIVSESKFKEHLLKGGGIKPILKDALIWIIIAFIIDFFIVYLIMEVF